MKTSEWKSLLLIRKSIERPKRFGMILELMLFTAALCSLILKSNSLPILTGAIIWFSFPSLNLSIALTIIYYLHSEGLYKKSQLRFMSDITYQVMDEWKTIHHRSNQIAVLNAENHKYLFEFVVERIRNPLSIRESDFETIDKDFRQLLSSAKFDNNIQERRTARFALGTILIGMLLYGGSVLSFYYFYENLSILIPIIILIYLTRFVVINAVYLYHRSKAFIKMKSSHSWVDWFVMLELFHSDPFWKKSIQDNQESYKLIQTFFEQLHFELNDEMISIELNKSKE